jgi:hypothetical protein
VTALDDPKVAYLVRAATERGYTVEHGAKDSRRPWESHWIARRDGQALYGDPDTLIRRLEGERERAHNETKE